MRPRESGGQLLARASFQERNQGVTIPLLGLATLVSERVWCSGA